MVSGANPVESLFNNPLLAGPNPVESFFNNPLLAVRDALSPLESGFRRATRDLESNNIEFFSKFSGSATKKPSHAAVAVDERGRRSPSFEVRESEPSKRAARDEGSDASCSNCLHFAVAWSLLANSFAQAFPSPFKSVKKRSQKPCSRDDTTASDLRRRESHHRSKLEISASKEGQVFQLDLFLCYAFDRLVRIFQVFDQGCRESSPKSCDRALVIDPSPLQFDCVKMLDGIIKGKKADFDGFLSNMSFARVGGAPPNLVGVASAVKDGHEDRASGGGREEPTMQRIANVLLSIPLSNVEHLRSTLSTVSLTELIEFVPQLGVLGRSSTEHPDKKKLFYVQDFFRYTETEGRRFFEELDRDGDGQVTLEDLEIAMRKRRLPRRYARDFLRRTRRHLFSKSIGWKQFLSLMEQKEPTILRAYTTLCLRRSGTLKKNQILTSLKSAGLPANEDNAVAMMRYLNADTGASISYSHFRNFMLLLPSERLEDDPRNIWFEAATVVSVSPPVEISAESVLKSALAGGLACALSTSVMHPVDTMKTRVQASTLSFPELVSKLPQIGLQGLYRGSIPAILGQFSSHGLRTGIFETSKLILINVAPTLPAIQVQSMASFCSTVLGTAVRIPCEVLKQRLQAGIFDNVGEAIVGTLRQDGIKGFFRGTGATLLREVPFYVAGMGLYEEAKKGAQKLLSRDLRPWETIAVGALSGGLAAVVTTPFDVMKTRMMTAPQGLPVSMQMVVFTILRQEGPLGLFKGAVPRFFWIAPLGAMNFAGYELAKKAMDRTTQMADDQSHDKCMASSR